MANKKALDLDQLKTSLSTVKNRTSGEITNATKNKVDKDTVLLKDNTTEYTPTADYNPSTKKYVDDKVTEAGGEYISANGGEYEYKNPVVFHNIPSKKVLMSSGSNTIKHENGDDVTYQNYIVTDGFMADCRTEQISDYMSTTIQPCLIMCLDNHIAGDHRHSYMTDTYLCLQRYNNGWKDFLIKAEKDRTLIYNDQKLIDFNDSRLEKVGNPVEDSDAVTKKYADTESKVAKRFVFDSDDNIIGVKIKDQVNNYNYILCMRNGTLATTCAVKSISITTNPTKMTYTAGSTIDTTGMIVTATCEDNSTREITGYTCTNTVTADNPKFTISYTEGGTTCTTELTVTVSAS